MSKKQQTEVSKADFAMGKKNYTLLAIGFTIVVVGFLLMIGGKTTDPNTFNANELFSFRRITLAPIIVLAGFAFVGYAIMKKSEE